MAKLRAAECRDFIQAVTEKAAEMGVPITVAIVGSEGHLIALERMERRGLHHARHGTRKSVHRGGVQIHEPTLTDGLVIQQWFKERNPQMLINASVFTNGQVVVSGGAAPVFVYVTLHAIRRGVVLGHMRPAHPWHGRNVRSLRPWSLVAPLMP
jgi:glc operon protein GlcG